jgi:putative ABC transport system substrate-binding protein
MRRREFFLGALSLVTPVSSLKYAGAAEGQKRVAVLMGTADDSVNQRRLAAFRQGLQELGWEESKKLQIEVRWSVGDAIRAKEYANDLVALAPDAILATNTPTARALKQATETIPTVFAGLADPIADGIVVSLANPSGNITGFVSFSSPIAGKWLQLLKEVAPNADHITVLYNPDTAPFAIFLPVMESIAPSFGMKLSWTPVRDKQALEGAINALSGILGSGLVIMPDVFMALHSQMIFELAIRNHLPTVSPLRQFAVAGSLISYGSNFDSLFHQAASYVDRILRGEKPRNLPVQEPTKYELVLNLKTARALDIVVPPSLVGTADEIIE